MRNRTTFTPAAAAASSFSRIARKNRPQRDVTSNSMIASERDQQCQPQVIVRRVGAAVEQRRHFAGRRNHRVTSFSDTMTMRSTSENATVNSAR